MADINLRNNIRRDFYSFLKGKKDESESRQKVIGIMEQYLENTFYTEAGYAYKEVPYGIQVLLGEGILGYNVALEIQKISRQNEEEKTLIEMTDVINPYRIPTIRRIQNKNESGFVGNKKLHLFEDDKFLVGVVSAEKKIQIFFYKK